MPYALCPMPYALCPMPYARLSSVHLMLLRKSIKASICLPQTRLMPPGRQQNQSILWQWHQSQRKGALSS